MHYISFYASLKKDSSRFLVKDCYSIHSTLVLLAIFAKRWAGFTACHLIYMSDRQVCTVLPWQGYICTSLCCFPCGRYAIFSYVFFVTPTICHGTFCYLPWFAKSADSELTRPSQIKICRCWDEFCQFLWLAIFFQKKNHRNRLSQPSHCWVKAESRLSQPILGLRMVHEQFS
jgi:hypothetical protein